MFSVDKKAKYKRGNDRVTSIVQKMISLMIVGSIVFRFPNMPINLLVSGSSGRPRVNVISILVI